MSVPTTAAEYEALTGQPLAGMAQQCHVASLALVQALGYGRVARGFCKGIGSQHSWAVLGEDCYDPDAEIADPSMWSWLNEEPYVWTGTARDGLHVPHGAGSIWDYGRPPAPAGEVIELAVDPGPVARAFLDMAAPEGLDRDGWDLLLRSPVGGWPAKEVVEAACQTPRISAYIPIDIIGMLTDRNPQGLYR